IIRFAIENPVKVSVGVILLVLFGVLSVFRIPIQLTPDVDQPRVTVTTYWHGASVREIEREIVERQEEKLKGVSNLRKMTSTSAENSATIALEFFVGVDKNDALRDVSEKMRQVSGYPEEVEEPIIQAADAAAESAIAWLIFRGRPEEDASTLYDYVDDRVKPLLERVPGVASLDIYGGRERELHIRVNPQRLAARHLTFQDLERAIRDENLSVSAGTLAQGKRDYTYRTVGKYERIEQVENTVIGYDKGGPIFLRDVATVVKTHKKQRSFVTHLGDYVLALPVRRETGANVIKVMETLKERIAQINHDLLEPEGRSLTQAYDETVYIHSAIDLVKSNMVFGGLLAVGVLLIFLRNGRATFVVAAAIPISIIGTFLVVTLLGRNLNVVMLAGLAFAIGMVVDNAVVVLENIFRHRQLGATLFQAALKGAGEVWGAVLASTLTTMAVFIPVVFVEEEAGQLFRDIAIAISSGVGLSLLVSILVIPPLANKILHLRERHLAGGYKPGRVASMVAWLVDRINQSIPARVGLVVGLTAAALAGAFFLMPPTDYLPKGNQNMIFGMILAPPGYSLDEYRRMGRLIMEGKPSQPYGIRQFWEAKLGSEAAEKLPPVQMSIGNRRSDQRRTVELIPPPIGNYFYVAYHGNCFMGCISQEENVVTPLVPVMQRAAGLVEGTFSFFFQASIFGAAGGGGNNIELEILGNDLDEVTGVAGMLFFQCVKHFGFAQPTPSNFSLPRDEIQFVPNRVKAAHVGLTVRDVAFVVASAVDGAFVGGFRDRGDEIDMAILIDHDAVTKEDVAQVPIYTPGGRIIPLSSVVDVVPTTAPQEVLRIEELPAVRIVVTPPEGVPLEEVMQIIEDEMIKPGRESGAIPPAVTTRLAGNADKLVETFNSVKWNLALALLITYLLMAALFESFSYPFVIMFAVPPATVGGFLALAIMHWVTGRNPLVPTIQLDVVTMLGFIILIGIVVNNAILIVHQALNNMRDGGMQPHEAIVESVRTRVRPIFMTALTSICGMLPLVVMTGAGSELYRGIGSVVVGGLLVSTVFTLFLVPALFSLFFGVRGWLANLIWKTAAPAPAEAAPPIAGRVKE
ncbi:MAG: efflux RND transporter permease subunit, partial [Phycisphaerae bacterium]|nr:efflux RND transporter permease subunit [Phycisphaerae bacterium]